jgi:hypothetical protein
MTKYCMRFLHYTYIKINLMGQGPSLEGTCRLTSHGSSPFVEPVYGSYSEPYQSTSHIFKLFL